MTRSTQCLCGYDETVSAVESRWSPDWLLYPGPLQMNGILTRQGERTCSASVRPGPLISSRADFTHLNVPHPSGPV
jgi:hypothetical protein